LIDIDLARPDYARYRVVVDAGVSLDAMPTRPGHSTDEAAGRARIKHNRRRLQRVQERLYAEGRQALLVVLQAMDTGGKDSTIRKVTGRVNPQGCDVTNFRSPNRTERRHDFLWRVHRRAPAHGKIGIFNRSHYEDVLIARVHGLAPMAVIERRYRHINEFERLLVDHGTRIVKIMLHISSDYQLKRLRRRLRKPDKHWKFEPADLVEREHWGEYMRAYELALTHCSTEHAPWYVIPAECRWMRNLLVGELLADTLEDMDPCFPPPTFDVADYAPESLR